MSERYGFLGQAQPVLLSVRSQMDHAMKWRCNRCGKVHSRNPTECSKCGHTVMAPAGTVGGIRWGRAVLFLALLSGIVYAHLSGSISLFETVTLPGSTSAPLGALLGGVLVLYLLYTAGIRRTMTYAVALVVIAGVVIAVGATAGTGVPAVDNASESLVNASWSEESTPTATLGATPRPGDSSEPDQPTPTQGENVVHVGEINVSTDDIPTRTQTATPPSDRNSEFDLRAVEREFIELLNAERQSRGLQTLTHRTVLTEMGRAHSENMARNNYIGHIEPNGDTIEDRYRDRGLLPECELSIDGTRQYYAGAENAAKTHIGTPVLYDWAADGTYTIESESELAYALFQGWMHSEGHREAMLVASADQAGLGISITDDDEVYASLELC